MHQAERVTIAKLGWLLGKATAAFGEVRLAELSPKDIYASRLNEIPVGAPVELAPRDVGKCCRAYVVVLSCSGGGGADRGRLRREGVDGQPAMVKFSRTTLEMGCSLPVISAGAVPLTA